MSLRSLHSPAGEKIESELSILLWSYQRASGDTDQEVADLLELYAKRLRREQR